MTRKASNTKNVDRKDNCKARSSKPPFSGSTRGLNKQQRRDVEIEDTAKRQFSTSNPPAEYMKYDAYARDAAKLPFAYPLGEKINMADSGTARYTSIPGLAVIHFIPTIGVSRDFTSAINLSSQNFWTYLRSIQKAAGSYDHQDITMMVLAVDQAYMFHAFMRRVYRVLRSYNPLNRYIPRILLEGMGLNFDDIIKHIAELREYINHYGFRATQYAMPKDISLFWRHQWMCEGVYKDGNTSRSQMYMFQPSGFYVYNNTVETGSQLEYKPFPQSATTFEMLVNYGDSIINAMSGDEDFAQISGDMFQAYGGSTYTLPYVNELDEIVPSYDETVLSQINNIYIMGRPYLPSLVIKQSNEVNRGALIFEPYFYDDLNDPFGAESYTAQHFLNCRHESPTPEEVIDFTRLHSVMGAGVVEAGGSRRVNIEVCGTEIVEDVVILSFDFNTTSVAPKWHKDPIAGMHIGYSSLAESEDNLVYLRGNVLSTQFDWFPIMHAYSVVYEEGGTTRVETIGFFGDVDNLTPVTHYQLKYMTDAALMSLFRVPGMS